MTSIFFGFIWTGAGEYKRLYVRRSLFNWQLQIRELDMCSDINLVIRHPDFMES